VETIALGNRPTSPEGRNGGTCQCRGRSSRRVPVGTCLIQLVPMRPCGWGDRDQIRVDDGDRYRPEVTTKPHIPDHVYAKTAPFSGDSTSFGPYVTHTNVVQYSGSIVPTDVEDVKRASADQREDEPPGLRCVPERSEERSDKAQPNQVRTYRSAPTRTIPAAGKKHCSSMDYGLPQSEEGFSLVHRRFPGNA
jgi:hypothetical protein